MANESILEKSILETIKHKLNLMADYTPFDTDIIIDINSAFARLHQLGVGPDKVFSISDNSSIWSDFIADERINSVIDYVYLKVQLLFDHGTNSGVMSLKKEQIAELEWTLKVVSEDIREEKKEGD